MFSGSELSSVLHEAHPGKNAKKAEIPAINANDLMIFFIKYLVN
ncbi:hypothetical protein [Treponema berlinense]|nr:hypothetical protein [Treponema berlinense]